MYFAYIFNILEHVQHTHHLCVIHHLAHLRFPQMSCSLVIEAVLHRLLVLTSYKPHVAHLYNQVTVKPGQRLYMVNQQYPYTVKFTEDTSTPRSAAELSKPSKRAHRMSSEGNGEKIKSPANTTSDHHRMTDDSPPPKKTLPSGSDKSVSFIWSGIFNNLQ